MIRTLEASHEGHDIFIRNSWFGGLKLFIDGELVAHDKRLVHLDKHEPFLTHTLETASGETVLTIYVEAIWDIKIALMADDTLIATTHPDAVRA